MSPAPAGAAVIGIVHPADEEPSRATAGWQHVEVARPIALGPDGRDSAWRAPTSWPAPQWIDELRRRTSRRYLVVGRTDDLKFNGTVADNKTYNDYLAGRRRDAAVTALEAAGVNGGEIISRIESEAAAALLTGCGVVAPGGSSQQGRLALPTARCRSRRARAGRYGIRPGPATAPLRRHKTGADVGGGSVTDAPTSTRSTSGRHSAAATAAVGRGRGRGPAYSSRARRPAAAEDPLDRIDWPPPQDYRVRLAPEVGQPDSRVAGRHHPDRGRDARRMEGRGRPSCRATSAAAVRPARSRSRSPRDRDFWEAVLRFAYDTRTEADPGGRLTEPAGWAMTFRSDAFAGALAFGPALMASSIPPSTAKASGPDAEQKFVLAAAILAAGAIVGETLNERDGPESTVDIDKLIDQLPMERRTRVSATVDYTVDLQRRRRPARRAASCSATSSCATKGSASASTHPRPAWRRSASPMTT